MGLTKVLIYDPCLLGLPDILTRAHMLRGPLAGDIRDSVAPPNVYQHDSPQRATVSDTSNVFQNYVGNYSQHDDAMLPMEL